MVLQLSTWVLLKKKFVKYISPNEDNNRTDFHPENPKILQILIQTSLFHILAPFRKVCLDFLRLSAIYFPLAEHNAT